METLTPHLHASAPYDLGFGGRVPLMARAYLLQREQGNLLLYGAQAIEPELEAVRRLGGVRRQYLNHSHEASAAADRLGEALGAPLLVHERDAAETAQKATVGETFTARHLVGDDFEVIPVPGHTEGATVYLWTADGHRVLFTGDTIYIRRGEWVAAVLDGISDRERYLESLALIRDLDFDLLVPGIAPIDQPYYAAVDHAEAVRRIDAIIERLRAGRDQ